MTRQILLLACVASFSTWAVTTLPSCASFVGEQHEAGADDSGSANTPDAPDPQHDAANEPLDSGRVGYADLVRADRPLLYFRLGEPIGELAAKDEMSVERGGTYEGSLDLAAAGALAGDPDTALDLHGPSAVVRAGDRLDLAQNSRMSIEAWVRLRAPVSVGHQGHVAVKLSPTGAGWRLFFWMNDATPVIRFDRQIDWDVRTFCMVTLANQPTEVDRDNAYHHVVVSYDTVTTRIFVDTVERATCTEGGLLMPDTDTELTVGQGIDGQLDEVAIYDQALTSPQIEAHYAAARPPP